MSRAVPSGEEMRRLRDQSGLTVIEAALRIGVSAPTIQRWETGAEAPTPALLARYQAQLLPRRSSRGSA